jgi:ATP-dependent DNA ligase
MQIDRPISSIRKTGELGKAIKIASPQATSKTTKEAGNRFGARSSPMSDPHRNDFAEGDDLKRLNYSRLRFGASDARVVVHSFRLP